MILTLDAELEQRIQAEIDRGNGRDAGEVIAKALDSLEAEASWTEEEKAELDRRFDRSMAAFDRGDGISGDKLRELLQQRRAAKVA